MSLSRLESVTSLISQRSHFRHDLVLPFQPIDLQQFLIPLAFQTSCDQPIVRVHGTVTAASQVRLILRAFDLSPRLLIDLFGARFQLGKGRERDFQPSRFDGFQKAVDNSLIDPLPAHGLTGFHCQLGVCLATFVDQQRAVPLVANRHAAPTGATEHDARPGARDLRGPLPAALRLAYFDCQPTAADYDKIAPR
jgi:hypothetical protein